MEEREEMQKQCFSIISWAGNAKSCYVEAVAAAREGQLRRAQELMEEGRASYVEGHRVHAQMIAKEASGEQLPMTLLTIHAEVLLADAETFRLNALEYLHIYQQEKGGSL